MPWIDVGPIMNGGPNGVTWNQITEKPAVIAAGADAATARTAIGAGTSDLALGTTSTTAMPGDTAIPTQPSDIGAQPAGSYATATQGGKADTALQPGTGLTVVYGGTDANTPRPAGVPAGGVKWVMTVAPVNALEGDDGYGW